MQTPSDLCPERVDLANIALQEDGNSEISHFKIQQGPAKATMIHANLMRTYKLHAAALRKDDLQQHRLNPHRRETVS